MSITGIGNSTLAAISAITNSQTAKTPSSIPPAVGAASTAKISKPAELLQKLQQLQQQDPTKFKEVALQLADGLQHAADQSGNSNGFAGRLASAFKAAADTGDLSSVQAALTPRARPNASTTSESQSAHGHHHGHHHGGGLGSSLSSLMSQIDAALQGSGTSTSANGTAATE